MLLSLCRGVCSSTGIEDWTAASRESRSVAPVTRIPGDIEQTGRLLPMGYWKGSGMSILLDMIATVLTDANSTSKIGEFGTEIGLSQILIAIDPKLFTSDEIIFAHVEAIIADLKESVPIDENEPVRYPGENRIKIREENLAQGIPVHDEIWQEILSK